MTISLAMKRTASGFVRSENGWVVLTKDQRLRYRPLEIAALRASKARVFVLTAGNLRGIEIASVILAALRRICKSPTFPGLDHLWPAYRNRGRSRSPNPKITAWVHSSSGAAA